LVDLWHGFEAFYTKMKEFRSHDVGFKDSYTKIAKFKQKQPSLVKSM